MRDTRRHGPFSLKARVLQGGFGIGLLLQVRISPHEEDSSRRRHPGGSDRCEI